jgi:PAS domain S-box-containing protein
VIHSRPTIADFIPETPLPTWNKSRNSFTCLPPAEVRLGLGLYNTGMAQAEDCVQQPDEERPSPEPRRPSEEKLAQILAFSPYSICMTDLQGTILECNPAGHRLHGFEPGELIGKPCLDLVAPEERNKARQGMRQTLEQGAVHHVELTMLTKDGRTFPADLSARVIRDAQGCPTTFVVVIQDITERKQALEAFDTGASLQRRSTHVAAR